MQLVDATFDGEQRKRGEGIDSSHLKRENTSSTATALGNVPGFPTARKTGGSSEFLPSETRFFEGLNPVLVILQYTTVHNSIKYVFFSYMKAVPFVHSSIPQLSATF